MSISNDAPILSSLFSSSSSYLIAYAVPCFLISLVLTFGGTFLMLDRTRKKKKKNTLTKPTTTTMTRLIQSFSELEGGIGGVMIGYAFGVHLSTFPTLDILFTNSPLTLSPAAFTAIWVFSSLFSAFLSGRYAIVALMLTALTGGSLFCLALSIIIHPPLEARIVLVIVGMCVLLLGTLLSSFLAPLSKFKHGLCRFGTASTGSFGVTMSIALLSSSTPSWSSPYTHLYLSSSASWSSSAEKAFSAMFCLLFILGCVGDWALNRKWGESPEERWDEYLEDYLEGYGGDPNRAGVFEKEKSLWEKVVGSFSMESAQAKSDSFENIPTKLRKSSSKSISDEDTLPVYEYNPPAGLLSKKHRRTIQFGRRKEVVKFRPLDEDDDSEDDETADRAGPPEYSDYEDEGQEESDISTAKPTLGTPMKTITPNAGKPPSWSPSFLKDHRRSSRSIPLSSTSSASSEQTAVPMSSTSSSVPSSSTAHMPSSPTVSSASPVDTVQLQPQTPTRTQAPAAGQVPVPVPGLVAVPPTPSLLTAINRVERARKEAYTFDHGLPSSPSPGLHQAQAKLSEGQRLDIETGKTEAIKDEGEGGSEEQGRGRGRGRGQRWDEFWKDVKEVGNKR
ncbi:hypothetical protein FB446DRAFT_95316 [Lentinula raphanica]|nr:hypothetical protein FB446DRAFT_95316 [Lentinula raphanica]